LLGGIANLRMETNNLLVEALLVASVPAHEHGEDGLVPLPGNALRRRPIGVPGRLVVGRLRRPKDRAIRQTRDERGAPHFHKVIP